MFDPRRIGLSLALVSLVAAVSSSSKTAGADGYSPVALAEKKALCTTKAQLSQTCVEFYQDVVIGKNALKVDRSTAQELRMCFERAKRFEEVGQESWTGTDATAILRKREAGDESAKNKYADECVRVTTALLGLEWKTSALGASFKDRVRKAVNADFESKCGLRADVRSDGESFSLVMWGKGKKKDVVFEDKDAEGNTVSILCNGFVLKKSPSGRATKVAPKSIDEIKKQERAACQSECQMSDSVCTEGQRRGKVTRVCSAYCKDKCR